MFGGDVRKTHGGAEGAGEGVERCERCTRSDCARENNAAGWRGEVVMGCVVFVSEARLASCGWGMRKMWRTEILAVQGCSCLLRDMLQ